MESNKNQASDGIKKQRSRTSQIHKMHQVLIEFYHFLVEIIFFTNNANKKFLRTFKHLKKVFSSFSQIQNV